MFVMRLTDDFRTAESHLATLHNSRINLVHRRDRSTRRCLTLILPILRTATRVRIPRPLEAWFRDPVQPMRSLHHRVQDQPVATLHLRAMLNLPMPTPTIQRWPEWKRPLHRVTVGASPRRLKKGSNRRQVRSSNGVEIVARILVVDFIAERMLPASFWLPRSLNRLCSMTSGRGQ